jgi:hypothetical protein
VSPLVLVALLAGAAPGAAAPEGQLTWVVATLHRIQQLVHDTAMYPPLWELGFIHAHGPRVAESGLGLINGWAFSAPYEDLRLKGQ